MQVQLPLHLVFLFQFILFFLVLNFKSALYEYQSYIHNELECFIFYNVGQKLSQEKKNILIETYLLICGNLQKQSFNVSKIITFIVIMSV